VSVFIEYLLFKILDTLSSHSWMPLLTTDLINLHVVLHGVGCRPMETNKDDAQQDGAVSTLKPHVFARVGCRLRDPAG
jgi:hypothetical protein